MPDVVIAGAGLVGMACALECERRGLRVMVLERGLAARQASWAAAGMLAAHDPGNPAALEPFAKFSIGLYQHFIDGIRERSGAQVCFETEWVLEPTGTPYAHALAPHGFAGKSFGYSREQSFDPRKLSSAITQAVRTSSIDLREGTPVRAVCGSSAEVMVHTPHESLACGAYMDCTGAWSAGFTRPAKGQMLRVYAPGALTVKDKGNVVVRTQEIYLVPRLDGSVVIGATVEDVGFDTSVRDTDLNGLRLQAASLLPSLVDAPEIERWAGLRPDTPDHLPFMGATGERTFIAAGHFRNGVLLAPATAHVMAEIITGKEPHVDLHAFSPQRFTRNAGQRSVPGAVFEHV